MTTQVQRKIVKRHVDTRVRDPRPGDSAVQPTSLGPLGDGPKVLFEESPMIREIDVTRY